MPCQTLNAANNVLLLFLGVVYSFFLTGCAASLPDVPIVQTNKPITPEIVGPAGKISGARARAVLAREQQGVHAEQLISETVTLMESVGGDLLTAGNRIDLLVDGPAAYKAMLNAIETAKDHINFETFTFSDDDVGQIFSQAFIRKQAEGVQVNLIYDSFGSIGTPHSFFKALRDAGVNVLEFNPVNPLKARKKLLISQRDHRKVVVVDGKIGFTGGINVTSAYYGRSYSFAESGGKSTEGWRDTHIRIEGPAVADLQRAFIQAWRYQNGPTLTPRDYFPRLETHGKMLAQVIPSYRGETHRLTYIMYLAAIRNAKCSIDLTTPYFIPDHRIREALAQASKRGVDVRLILPSSSDSTLALNAGRSFYEDLLETGVRIYELKDRMLHAKTVVIDGVWSTVGSTNMDSWSLIHNNEINVIVIGKEFADEMETLFEQDLKTCNEISEEQWAQRPLWNRIKQGFAKILSPWL